MDDYCQNKDEKRDKMYPISEKETVGKFKINFLLKLFRIISLYLNPLVYVLFFVFYALHYAPER